MSLNFIAAFTVCSDFRAQEKKICHCFHFFPFYLPSTDGTGCHDLSFLNIKFQARFPILLFHPHQEALYFLFAFWHYSGITCISEVVISPSNLDSSLWFIQPDILHDVLCIDAGKDWRQEEKETTEDEMFGRHRWHDGGGQRSLVCFSPWSHRELDMTEWLNNNSV